MAYHTFCQSVITRTEKTVSFTPVTFDQKDGSNSFIYGRFLVPHLCNHEGWAIFVDGDMTCLTDINKLWLLRDPVKAVQVVKHEYKTKYPIKYWGNKNEDYPRKNWSSVILWNCGHTKHNILTPDYVRNEPGSVLHRFRWLDDSDIGELPVEWNYLALEQLYHPDAKIVHHSIGLPIDPAATGDPWHWDWVSERSAAMRYKP